jgi:CubicO group peptidase (beta-lactamase class C family)
MKKKLTITLLIAVMQVTVSFSQQSESSIAQKADSLLQDAFSKKIFTGLVSISHNGKMFYYNQLGFADWNTQRPLDKNTLFNIGSLNKQFTEEMIHQLVKENKLSYDDKLSKYLDMFPPETGNKISIQQLLDMKAGLGDYLQDPEFRKINSNDFSMSDLIAIIKQEPLLFEPGTGSEYSNSGYVVLGAVIEKITGKTYEENLRERIAKPLGLKNIYYTKSEKEKQVNRAFGTAIDFEGNKKSTDDIANSTPAGGIYTNVNDLMKFTEAKLKSDLPSGMKYGKGMFAGGTQVWNSTISFNDKNGFAFVIMANAGNIADELAPRLNDILKGESYPPLELPFQMTLYKIIKDNGTAYVKANAEKLAEQAGLPYDDRFLNYFGYQFLNGGKKEIAIELFKINTELFPKVANTYDSLAEAYLASGDKENALKYYKIELQLDPENRRAKKVIADLENKN